MDTRLLAAAHREGMLRGYVAPEFVLTPELVLELKGHLVLLVLGQSLGDISRWQLSEVMVILREVGELAGLWLRERESIQRGDAPPGMRPQWAHE
jgi:hypothetical protein